MFCDHLFTALLVKSEKLLQVKAFYIFRRHVIGLYLSVAAPGRRAPASQASRDSVYTYRAQPGGLVQAGKHSVAGVPSVHTGAMCVIHIGYVLY